MTIDKINSLLRKYVKDELSPRQEDRDFVSKIYSSFNELLGTNNCVQIGSYPRRTSVRPLHDLDILYIIGDWNNKEVIPTLTLTTLAENFKRDYKNPTSFEIEITVQTHSISFKYLNNKKEIFAVDLVPALRSTINEFKKYTFFVPEIIKQHRGEKRSQFYENIKANHKEIKWIKSDPLGYIEIAFLINQQNDDFRRSVKFVKGWKNYCKKLNDQFGLKSFHLEQLITRDYLQNNQMSIFDSLFIFFTNLKTNLTNPNITDRADSSKFIDQYIMDLSMTQIEIIKTAIDGILISFEKIREDTSIGEILQSGFYKRIGANESFLFDLKIPTLVDEKLKFCIDGNIAFHDGFRNYRATVKKSSGIVDTKNRIEFRVTENSTNCDLVKWKVRNDNNSPQPRGEITNHKTLNDPELTAYLGKHFAECYAIKDNTCIAMDIVHVIVRA